MLIDLTDDQVQYVIDGLQGTIADQSQTIASIEKVLTDYGHVVTSPLSDAIMDLCEMVPGTNNANESNKLPGLDETTSMGID